MNRLHLDFHLNTSKERNQFVTEYITRDEFQRKPLTAEELETIGNYILWGKDAETGQNFVQDKLGEIETRNKTWTATNVESLDALMESSNFNESMLNVTHTKKVRETFSRSEALAQCPDYLREPLQNLFRQIDEIDLGINYYELSHGRRTKDIREQLLNKFTIEERKSIQEATEHWNQYFYLKQKHLLVELRREQFTYRDSFVQVVQRNTVPMPDFTVDKSDGEFDTDIPVLPLGAYNDLVFLDYSTFDPAAFDEEQLTKISKYLWDFKNLDSSQFKHVFDFREREHVYQLFQKYYDIEDSGNEKESQLQNGSNKLLDTLHYYIQLADLDEIHQTILEQKIQKRSNVDIALDVNRRFGKSYSANYISTIFRQKIIDKINAAAARHLELIENIFFEENFKKCTCCGRWLLRDTTSFVKKSRSPDGLNTRCKKCDKLVRLGRKQNVGS